MTFRNFASLVLAAALLSAGCSKSNENPAGGSAPEKPKIALVMKSLANEFFNTMAAGATRHQQAHANRV